MITKTAAYLKLLEVLRDLRSTEDEREEALQELKKLQAVYEGLTDPDNCR